MGSLRTWRGSAERITNVSNPNLIMHTTEQGILRNADYDRQEQIKEDMKFYFTDLFDSIDATRSNAKEVESALRDILYGRRCEFSDRPRR